MEIAENIRKKLFYIVWAVFLTYNILDNSAWVALSEGFTFTKIFTVIKYILAAACMVIIIIDLINRIYSKEAIAAFTVLGVIIALSAWKSGNHMYIWYFLIFAAAYRQDAGKIVTVTALVTAAMLVVIVGCSLIGLGTDYIFDAATRKRHGLGFGWTTTGPVLFLFFILQYIFLRRGRMKFYEYMILEAAAVFFYVMTDTNLAFYASTAILVFMFAEGLIKNRWQFWRRLKWLWILFPVIICLIVMAVFIIYNRENSVWAQINSMVHNRLTLGQNGIREYGFTLFGQPITWNGFFIYATEVADYNYIDCSYLQLCLEMGILFILAVLAVYTKSMYEAVKQGDFYLVFILVLVLLFSVMEPRLMNMTFNVFPLMAFLSQGENVT